jgi:DNA-binding NarL/FixJ family response regulator
VSVPSFIFLSHDAGLIQHWQRAFRSKNTRSIHNFTALLADAQPAGATIWVDRALPGLPALSDAVWSGLLPGRRIVFASSRPTREEAIQALDKGCAGYCHAYADAKTLRQVSQVVEAGHVWVGTELMQQLLSGVSQAAAAPASPVVAGKSASSWASALTEREHEVAQMAANGDSNRDIAERCAITERTVKAHLGAVFVKLAVVDRLQLALRVHGIR